MEFLKTSYLLIGDFDLEMEKYILEFCHKNINSNIKIQDFEIYDCTSITVKEAKDISNFEIVSSIIGFKLYLIKNVDYANKLVLNILFKVLEEPINSVFFLISNTTNLICPLISRLTILNFKNKVKYNIEEFDILEENFKKQKKYFENLIQKINDKNSFVSFFNRVNFLKTVNKNKTSSFVRLFLIFNKKKPSFWKNF